MPKLRVGIGDILDTRPLAWGFLKGHHADLFSPVSHPLNLVGRLLAQGGLDVALVPAIEVARTPDLRVLPDLCVAFPGEARGALLVSSGPVEELSRVVLERDARAAAAVARIVLEDAYGLEPEYVEAEAATRLSGPERIEPGEGWLVIGNAALSGYLSGPRSEPLSEPLSESSSERREDRRVLDLGLAWRELTGLPLVVGVWAVRPGVGLPDLPFYFKSSLRFGLSALDAIAREAAAEVGVVSALLEGYLRENVSYFLREPELAGLDELFRRAARLGLVPAGAAAELWSG